MGYGAYHFSSGSDAIEELYYVVVKALGLTDNPQPEIKELARTMWPPYFSIHQELSGFWRY